MKFKLVIAERRKATVEVEAESAKEAIRIGKGLYLDGVVIPNAVDSTGLIVMIQNDDGSGINTEENN